MNDAIKVWPGRPWVLALLLAAAGFVCYLLALLLDDASRLGVATITFVLVFSVSLAFSLERIRRYWVMLFSLVWGLILALIAQSTLLTPGRGIDLGYSFWSGLLAVGIAVPLFQTMYLHGRLVLPYKDLHQNAWNNALSWCTSWAFVGINIGLFWLLHILFKLVDIDVLGKLMEQGWFFWVFVGASFGAALGVLKEHDRILSSLQNLVMTILSILAPVLCIGLLVFLLALPFTGLQPLWDATIATTPILLSCVIGALVLSNAVIGNAIDEESGNKLMRYSAFALSVCILPLAVIAFISMQQRVMQYGLTPDRIWGLIAVLVAVAYGLAYAWSLIKSGKNWTSNIRINNTRMAVLLCLLALFLALPIVNFGRISVNSQLARINQGLVEPVNVDFVAFAFDFGEAGQQALRDMQNSDNETLTNGAKLALAATNKWALKKQIEGAASETFMQSKLVVFPESVPLPDELQKLVNDQAGCVGDYCILLWEKEANTAQFIKSECQNYHNETLRCYPKIVHFRKKNDKWSWYSPSSTDYRWTSRDARKEAKRLDVLQAIEKGKIEVRTVERKQIFIDDKPVGVAF